MVASTYTLKEPEAEFLDPFRPITVDLLAPPIKAL